MPTLSMNNVILNPADLIPWKGVCFIGRYIFNESGTHKSLIGVLQVFYKFYTLDESK